MSPRSSDRRTTFADLEGFWHIERAIRLRAKHSIGIVRDVILYGRGLIVQLKTDKDLLQALERIAELVADVRAFISTRARGEK